MAVDGFDFYLEQYFYNLTVNVTDPCTIMTYVNEYGPSPTSIELIVDYRDSEIIYDGHFTNDVHLNNSGKFPEEWFDYPICGYPPYYRVVEWDPV